MEGNESEPKRAEKMNKNLIPLSERTKEERREIAISGGIASGKARAKKKSLRNAVEVVLKARAPNEICEEMRRKGIIDDDYYAALGFAIVSKALNGDVGAFNSIRDLIGEAPVNQVQMSAEMNNPFEGLTTEELRKILENE